MRNAILLLLTLTLQSPTSPESLANVRTITGETAAEVQIAIARAAGPPVSAAATIYVLGPHGYTRAVTGTNGFTCLITRDRPDVMAPECYDAAGEPSLKVQFFIEDERAKGSNEADIAAAVEDRYRQGTFGPPTRPGIVYMLSDYNYVFDPDARQLIHFPGHLMFYAPYLKASDVGSGPGAPFLTHPGKADNLMVVVPAPSHPH
jgi:hypothetical protein